MTLAIRQKFLAAAVGGRRATAVSWRALIVTTAFCLKGSAAQYREEYFVFAMAVRDITLTTVQKIDLPLRSIAADRRDIPSFWAANLKKTAEDVVQALKGAKDEETNRLGKDFGVAYASVVWNGDNPKEYKDVLTEGPWQDRKQHDQRYAARGAVTMQRCDSREPCPPELGEIGSMGCPCPTGAAVLVSALTKLGARANCMVYYYPMRHKESVDPLHLSGVFHVAVTRCMPQSASSSSQLAPSSNRIDLTQLASYIVRNSCIIKNPPPAETFKAVAVIPAFGPLRFHVPAEDKRDYLNTHFGVNSEFGHILVEHVQLQMPPGDQRLPVSLFFVAAIPIA